MHASLANIPFLIVVVFDFFSQKRASDEVAENEIIADSEPAESKPQKPESPGIIHVQESVEAPQLKDTEEINATVEHPKDVRVNLTARGEVQLARPTEPSAEKLLTSSKVVVSRSESDFEPPPCNCPGIYIFFLLVFLFKCTHPAGVNIPTGADYG